MTPWLLAGWLLLGGGLGLDLARIRRTKARAARWAGYVVWTAVTVGLAAGAGWWAAQ